MELRLQERVMDLLGFQSLTQFGIQQVQLQNDHGVPVECTTFLAPKPKGFEGTSLAVVKDNLAVIPTDWTSGGVIKPWSSVDGHDTLTTCMAQFRDASFVSFHEDFLDLIGRDATLEKIHDFFDIDAQHVHEAPVYVSTTNELVFADTAVVGWLWALEIDTRQIRKVNTNPPLENVNGATMSDSRIFLTTNGGRAPAVWNCSVPQGHKPNSEVVSASATESISCEPAVNNYRFNHLNSPNDLVLTSNGNILFTDPTYGWAQSWPGVGPPELPTGIYHFNTKTRALVALDNDLVLQPNGLALSADEKTLYIADSNSTSGKPIGVWEDSVRNVYAFDFDETRLILNNRRLVHMVDSGWPDGLRVARMGKVGKHKELVLAAVVGGIDVIDVSGGGAGILLGKWNVGDDVIFNLEPVVKGDKQAHARLNADTWLLTGRKGVYRVNLSPRA